MIYKPSELYIISLAEKVKHEDGTISYIQSPKLYFATKLKYNISIAPDAQCFKLTSSGLKFSTDKIYIFSNQLFVSKAVKALTLLPELANFKAINTHKLLGIEQTRLSKSLPMEKPKIESIKVPQIIY